VVKLLLIYGLFTKGTLTIESEHSVSETAALCSAGFVFIPKEHKHQFLTPTFREMMDKQKKAVVSAIKNGRTPQIRKIEFSRNLLWN
jgi:hypothetical protein